MVANPVYEQPDIEAFVWPLLEPLGGVTMWLAAAYLDYPGWQARYTLAVDARDGERKSRARSKAWQAQYVILGLPDAVWDAGVVTYVQPTIGPFYLPDDDGLPRYTAQYEIRCHPRNAIAPTVRRTRRRAA